MEKIKQQRTILLVAGIAVVAAVVLIGAQILAVAPSSDSPAARYENIVQERLPDGGFVIGNPEAPITVVEFADFACPHCQNYALEMKRFVDEYVATGKARYEYRMFISGADPTYGTYTAQLAECANEQREGAFWPAHDVLFEMGRTQGRFNDQTARRLADRLNLNYSNLLACAQNAKQHETDVRLGLSLNIQSTPTLMVRFGNSTPQFISVGPQTYNRGGVPYEILRLVVEGAQ
jgi:protein-disulfide isomerase